MDNKKNVEIGLCNYTTSNNGESICTSGYLAHCESCDKYDFNLTLYTYTPTCPELHNMGNTVCPNSKCCEFMGNTQNCIYCNKSKIFNSKNKWSICEKCVLPLIERNREFLLKEWENRDKN